jgi:hypothetical protein
VTKNVCQHAENSCKHVEQVVQSSCDALKEHHVDTNDDASNGLSMLAQGVQSDGTVVQVKWQRSSIFQSQCKIQDKVCKLIIDGASFTNAISSDLVAALSLPTWRLPTLHYIQWMNQSGMLKITHKARVKFSIGHYIDTVECDVAQLIACHLLSGSLWQFDLDATHGGHSNSYSFMHKGIQCVLKPMIEGAIKAEAFAPVKKKFNSSTIKAKPGTAFLQEGENNVCVPGRVQAANVSASPNLIFCLGSGATYKDQNNCSIQSGSPDFGLNNVKGDNVPTGKTSNNYLVVPDLKADYSFSACNMTKVFSNHSKPRTTLMQGGEDDESMVHQFSSTVDSGNISNDSIIAYGNYKESHIIQFGALHISINQCVDRSSLVQAWHKKTFMSVNWYKEVHCNLNYDGVELQREEKMKPQNKKNTHWG